MSFRELLNEKEEVNVTIDYIKNILDELELTPKELEIIAENLVHEFILFEEELQDDQLVYVTGDSEVGYDIEGFVDDIEDEEDEMSEAYIKKSKGERLSVTRRERKDRKKPQVKREIKKRAQKKNSCNNNQRVTKIGPNVYKCVPKTTKDKIKSKRLKKFKKLYKHG